MHHTLERDVRFLKRFLHDRDGHPRLRLIVDSLGSARVEFRDADGKVTYMLPGAPR